MIEEGCPVERAARRFSVPITTLKDRVNGRVDLDTVKSGPSTIFTQEEEVFLQRHLHVMTEVGFGYSRQETLNLASDFSFFLGLRDRQCPLSFDWFYSFMTRWPDLKIMKQKDLEVARAKPADEIVVTNYFEELQTILTKYDLMDKPHFIYNIDEKGISAEHKPPKLIAGKFYNAVTSGESKMVTIIGCGSAAGQQIPPFFVFPGEKMVDTLMEGASAGAVGFMSDSGLANSTIFEQYIKEHLVKYIPTRQPGSYALVLYDGHRRHVTIPLILWAIQQQIILFVQPPHCSNDLQQLDVCLQELAWGSACQEYLQEFGGKTITKYDVCKLACKAYTSTNHPSNLQAAFRKSGIYPFDPSMAVGSEDITELDIAEAVEAHLNQTQEV